MRVVRETKFGSNCGVRAEAYPQPPPPSSEAGGGEKPTAAFVLSLIAGILILIGGLGAATIGAICGAVVGAIPGAAPVGALIFLYMSIGLICGIVIIIGAIMINTANPSKVKTGSILVLVFSLIAFISGGGFLIGMVLGIVGGILGLVWKPK